MKTIQDGRGCVQLCAGHTRPTGCVPMWPVCVPQGLTDIVVAVSLLELLAQGEGREALEFLRQLLRAMLGAGLVALPANLVLGLGLAQLVLLALHQVQGVPLHGSVRHGVILIMRTDDIQVVIQPHVYRVVLIPEPARAQWEKAGGHLEARPGLRASKCLLAPHKEFSRIPTPNIR